MCYSRRSLGARGHKGQLVCYIHDNVMLCVVQALSGKDEPYQNCFLYNGVNSTGIVETLRP